MTVINSSAAPLQPQVATKPLQLLRTDNWVTVATEVSKRTRSLLERELTFMVTHSLTGKERQIARRYGLPFFEDIETEAWTEDQKGRFSFRYGFTERISGLLEARGYDVRVKNLTPHKHPEVFEPRWDKIFDGETTLRDMQPELLKVVAAYDCGRFDFPTGWGKAQPLDSVIQTPGGPIRMGDVKVGDTVCNVDGGSSKVLAINPQGEVLIYRITFADGDSVDCCEDHLWEVDSQKLGFVRPRVLETKALATTFTSPGGDNYYTIRVPQPIEMGEQEVELPPYLLGALLGDGGFKATTPVLTTVDQQVLRQVESCLRPGYALHNCVGQISYRLTRVADGTKAPNYYKQALRVLGLYGKKSEEKYIPKQYLYNSAVNRWALLRGLMDTDGTVDKTGMVSFSTSSPQLAADFKWLVESLGGICRIRPHVTKHLTNYRCNVRLQDATEAFTLDRKKVRVVERSKYQVKRVITMIKPIGRKIAQCITVSDPNGLYLTDHCVVTHNSFSFELIGRMLPKARIAIVSDSVTVVRDRIYPQLCLALPGVGIVGGGKRVRGRRIMCYTVDSLHWLIKDCEEFDNFDLILVDECHQAAAENCTYMLSTIPGQPRMFGLSATQDMRADGADYRCEGLFGPIRLKMEYEEARQKKIVADMEVRVKKVVMDVNPCQDYSNEEKMRHGIWKNSYRNDMIVEDAVQHVINGQQTMISCFALEHVLNVMKRFQRLKKKGRIPDNVELVPVYRQHDNNTDYYQTLSRMRRKGMGEVFEGLPKMTMARRMRLTRQIEKGKIPFFVTTTVFNVGFNAVHLEVVCRADATSSRIADYQVPGRGSRRTATKQKCIVRDYRDKFDAGMEQRFYKRLRSYKALKWKVRYIVHKRSKLSKSMNWE